MEVKLYTRLSVEGGKKFNNTILGIHCPTREEAKEARKGNVNATFLVICFYFLYFLVLE